MPDRLDDDRDESAGHQSDEDAAAHAPGDEDASHQQREYEDDRRDGADRTGAARAQPNGRRSEPGAADEAGVDEPDKQDEKADTGRDRELELHRHGVEDEPAQPGRREKHDDEPVDDDEAHRLGPGERANHGRCKVRVDAEPRGEGERKPRNQAEQNRHDACGK